ncbi:MAG: thioredoxin [Oscillospiraceae bacterium]|nr:thioredoxin [Oscillospiraceae bacterium]
MREIVLTPDNFEQEVLQAEGTVLVDFWASWCGPCRMIAPIVAEIAEEYAGRVTVGKVNVDEQQALAMQYRIESIPTILIFRKGILAEKVIGYRSKEQLIALL